MEELDHHSTYASRLDLERTFAAVGARYPRPATGLAISADGAQAYFVDGAGAVVAYTATTGGFSRLGSTGSRDVTAASIDPTNGRYYYIAGGSL